jgi:hypothetical protein
MSNWIVINAINTHIYCLEFNIKVLEAKFNVGYVRQFILLRHLLGFAIEKKNIALIRLLIEYVDLSNRDYRGLTPLELCCKLYNGSS